MNTITMTLASITMVLVTSAAAYADVEGLEFSVTISAENSADVEGVLAFDTESSFNLTADGGVDANGTFSETAGGGALTVIEGTGVSSDFDIEFVAISFDPKQLPGILGTLARRRGIPAQIQGFGTNNLLEMEFSFTGEEVLSIQ